MITPNSPISQQLQSLAETTNGIVTPANMIDVAAFGLAINAAPHLDTWQGIGKAAVAYGADLIDGRVARATGTSGEVGAQVDAVGDKLKVGLAMVHMIRLGVVDKDLAALIAVQNLANAGATLYDRVRNEEPTINAAQKLGKYAMLGGAMALGGQTIGTKLSETHPRAGQLVKKASRWLGLTTVATFGVGSFLDYVHTARTGTKKQRVAPTPARTERPSIFANATGTHRR